MDSGSAGNDEELSGRNHKARGTASMRHLSFLIKPASSLCNMRCRYCFYSDISAARETPSYGIMSLETADKILGNIFDSIDDRDEITFAFQGGEPLLAGLPWFRHFTETAASRKKSGALNYAVQTNGLLLDDAFCEFFHEHNFLTGLSIDAGRRFHDSNRLTASGGGTFAACLRAKALLEKHHAEYNILSVLTPDLAKEADRAWRFIINENIRFIQFIPCLGPLPGERADQKQASGNTLSPALFAKFYIRLLPRWMEEFEKGNYISIKFFDDAVNYFLRGKPTACGIDGLCHNQFVIEADGSVYPCDFYAVDQYRAGSLAESPLRELFFTSELRTFLSNKPELSEICAPCRFLKTCRGGCKRMQSVMYAGPGDAVCGCKLFLEKCLGPLEEVVRKSISQRR